MGPLISVIIPVYNVKEYLTKCLESILSQTLTNIEVIAIDDGSTDGSGKLLDKYVNKDNRLKVIHKQNEGVSEARNEGLKYASGEFITFVDSDDWIDTRMYEEMYNLAIEKNIDIIMCGYTREFNNHSKIKNFEIENRKIIKQDEIHKKFIRQMIGPVSGEEFITENLDMHSVIWNKIYHRDLLNNIGFCSLKEIGSCEDLLFNLQIFSRAKSITYINEYYYHYRKTSGNSVTNYFRPYLIEQRINLIKKIFDFINENQYPLEYNEALNNRICMGIMGLGLNIISHGNNANFLKKIIQIKEMLSKEQFVMAFRAFNIAKLPTHWRIFYFFAKEKRIFFYYFMLNIIKLAINIT